MIASELLLTFHQTSKAKRQKRKKKKKKQEKEQEPYHPAADVCPNWQMEEMTRPHFSPNSSPAIYLFRRRKIITQTHLAPSTEINDLRPMNHFSTTQLDFH